MECYNIYCKCTTIWLTDSIKNEIANLDASFAPPSAFNLWEKVDSRFKQKIRFLRR